MQFEDIDGGVLRGTRGESSIWGHQDVRLLRKKLKLLDNSIERPTEEEIDTDVELDHVGMILDGNRDKDDRKGSRVIITISGRRQYEEKRNIELIFRRRVQRRRKRQMSRCMQGWQI